VRTVKSCGPDAPMAGVKFLRSSRFSRATVTNKPGLNRGEHEANRKPLCRECRLNPVNLWRLPRVFYTEPRVHRTPGIPCALIFEGQRFSPSNSGAMRGEKAGVCRECVSRAVV
jgi:hypothetical protein